MDWFKILIVVLILLLAVVLITRGNIISQLLQTFNVGRKTYSGGDSETWDFPYDIEMLKHLVDMNEEKLRKIYQDSEDKKREFNFFIDLNGDIRDIREGIEHAVVTKAGQYTPTYLSVHTHPNTTNNDNVEGPSGPDLFATIGQAYDGLSKGEMIVCPNNIWFIFPSKTRLESFKNEPEYRGECIGEGQTLMRLFRQDVLSMDQYLDQLYQIGYDVFVYEKI